MQNLPVRLCMDRAGLSGDDGPTHHGLFDIGYLRHIPGIVMMQAKDEAEFVEMLTTMHQYDDGPGEAEVVSQGTDVTLIGLGNLFEMAEATKSKLEAEGYSVTLINPRFIKPLDKNTIVNAAKNCKVVCTFEDHSVTNGFGSAVLELLEQEGIRVPVERIGWPDQFIEHGKVPKLRELHGVTAAHAHQLINKHL